MSEELTGEVLTTLALCATVIFVLLGGIFVGVQMERVRRAARPKSFEPCDRCRGELREQKKGEHNAD